MIVPLVGIPLTVEDVLVPMFALKTVPCPWIVPTSSEYAATPDPAVHEKVTEQPDSDVMGTGLLITAG